MKPIAFIDLEVNPGTGSVLDIAVLLIIQRVFFILNPWRNLPDS